MKNAKAALFDLDGVIVDTAEYHFMAWKEIAAGFGYALSRSDNEKLKGVSRVDSLKKMLHWAQREISAAEFEELLAQKNEQYLSLISQMTTVHILPGITDGLKLLKRGGVKIALGSASKNGRTLLKQLEIIHFFDAIIDGNDVKKSKPDPEVFTKGSQAVGIPPEACLVFEDSYAGIEAAHAAGIKAVGIGKADNLPNADMCYESFEKITAVELEKLFSLSVY